MKGLNSLHFRNMLDFFFEFVPQFLLLFALFGWMDILIIAKWLDPKNIDKNHPYNMTPGGDNYHETKYADFDKVNRAPAIITTMIDIFLNMASNKDGTAKDAEGQPRENYYYLFGGQQTLSIIFLLVALLSAPAMLIVKPMILKKRIEAHQHHHVEVHSEKIEYSKIEGNGGQSDHAYAQVKSILDKEGSGDGHHSFGDIFIHQLIETIEFVLGTVSNTASYLRLWALSLAHSQLAAVFLELILVKYGGGFHADEPVAASIMVSKRNPYLLYSYSYFSSSSSR